MKVINTLGWINTLCLLSFNRKQILLLSCLSDDCGGVVLCHGVCYGSLGKLGSVWPWTLWDSVLHRLVSGWDDVNGKGF